MKITVETAVSPSELAAVLRITARHVRRLAEDGIFHKVDGAYNLAESLQAYVNYQADRQKRITTEEDLRLKRDILHSEAELKQARARIATLKAQELTGKLHIQEDVEEAMNNIVFSIRGAMLALPGRLAVNVAAVHTPQEARTAIQEEINIILDELNTLTYDPDFFRSKVMERMSWSVNEPDPDYQE